MAGGETGSDFDIQDCGSIFILAAKSEAARDWIAEHIPADAMTWGGGIVVERRYVSDIINGFSDDGLTADID